MSPNPVLTIGAEGDWRYEFDLVASALRLSDGNIVVTDVGSRQMRIYDNRGSFVHAVGRHGRGPGEFINNATLRRYPGDSLAIWDVILKRMSIYDRAGNMGRSIEIPPGTSGLGWIEIQDVLADGRLVGVARVANRRRIVEGVVRDSFRLYLFDPPTESVVWIGTYLESESYVSPRNDLAVTLFFFHSTQFGTHGTNVVVGTNDRYEFLVFDGSGLPETIIRSDREPYPISDQEAERAKRVRLDQDYTEEWRQRSSRVLDEMPIPATAPYFGDMRVDHLGYVWVEEYPHMADRRSTWTIYGLDGIAVGRTSLPRFLDIKDIGADYLLGVQRDEFEVERVELYSLARSAGQ